MKYNDLQAKRQKKPTRVGRGISAGKGKTAGRGTKGQNSRAGGHRRPGFEGGQTPFAQRMPKLRGITKGGRTVSDKMRRDIRREQITTGQLNNFAGKTVDNFALFEKGLLKSAHTNVKVIVKGELKNKVIVNLQNASTQAIEMITKAGGSFTKTNRIARQPKQKDN